MYVFSYREDMFTPDSVEQLQKAGIDFQRHEEYGILPNDFAELMITSGMVLSQDTSWISFHRSVEFHFHSEPPYNEPNGSCILEYGPFSNCLSTLIHWIELCLLTEDRFQWLRFWILRETLDGAIPSDVRGRIFRPSQNVVPHGV